MSDVVDAPKKRGRKPGSTTKGEPGAPKTMEELYAAQAKHEEKLLKLQAELAIRKNPSLENSINSILNFVREAKKADTAIKAGAEVNVEQQKQALQKTIDVYKAKIAQAEEQIAKASGDSITKQLEEAHTKALDELANAVKTLGSDFTNAGTSVEVVIPEIAIFKAEIDKRNA